MSRNEVAPRDLQHGLEYDLEIHDPKTNTTVLKKNMEFDGKRFKYNKRKTKHDGILYDTWDYYNYFPDSRGNNPLNKIYHSKSKGYESFKLADELKLDRDPTRLRALNKATNNNPDLNKLISGFGGKKTKKKGIKKKGSKKKINKKKKTNKKRIFKRKKV